MFRKEAINELSGKFSEQLEQGWSEGFSQAK
jgi:hypothetical protein